MPHYMIQGSYTPETWARLVRNPEDREPVVRRLLEQHGGKLEALYFTFGEDDFIVLTELPNNETAAAIAIATASSGALRNLRTTPLLTVREAMEALRKARGWPTGLLERRTTRQQRAARPLASR